VSGLTGQSSHVLKLFVSYLRFEEIAEITGKTLSAVKMGIYRGLGKLKELMSEEL
jgi:DNA-directed RNA polymerase specialized sigma24 family protein